jgi:hypothetical protein
MKLILNSHTLAPFPRGLAVALPAIRHQRGSAAPATLLLPERLMLRCRTTEPERRVLLALNRQPIDLVFLYRTMKWNAANQRILSSRLGASRGIDRLAKDAWAYPIL